MNAMSVAGLLLMIGSEAATLAHIEPFWSWNTPIAWTGFLLFADSLVWERRRNSWIRSAPREFAALALVSIPLWLVFEFYNRFIENWYYTGLPPDAWVRNAGYAWAFATIWPAIFEGAELAAVWRGLPRRQPATSASAGAPARPSGSLSPLAWVSIAAGVVMITWPLVRPSRYLAAPVWLGFVFLLDPVNEALGGESLAGDLRRHDGGRMINLLLSGLLCGLLWEFWNFWAHTKWHYTVPIMERWKLFEMPLPGFLGFPAFALECFTMYVFVRLMVLRLVVRPLTGGDRAVQTGSPEAPGGGRSIAL